MITSFKLREHSIRFQNNEQVVEIWYGDQFIGQITPADEDVAGFRIITRHIPETEILDLMVTEHRFKFAF